MADAKKRHKENSAKGGRIGGPKSPMNFRNNPELASAAAKSQKRGPAKIVCDWCGDKVVKRDLTAHQQAEHPNLYKKLIEPYGDEK